MSETVVFENQHATVVYNSDHNYIHHTIHKPIEGKALQDVLNAGTAYLAKVGATKWLSDDRNNSGLSEEDFRFGVEDWGPRTAAAGWKYWALVVPESVAGRSSMQDLIETYFSIGVRVMVFIDVESAKDWLAKQS